MTVFQNPLEDNSAVFEPNTSRAGGGVARADRPMDNDMLAEEEEYGDALGVMTIAKFGVSLGLNVTKGTLGTLGTLTPGLAGGGSPRTQSASREELRKLFDRLDVDGGGTLSPPELRELIHGLGVHLTEAELAATALEMISSVRRTISESKLSTNAELVYLRLPLLVVDTSLSTAAHAAVRKDSRRHGAAGRFGGNI